MDLQGSFLNGRTAHQERPIRNGFCRYSAFKLTAGKHKEGAVATSCNKASQHHYQY